jgi:hypothetical protein
MKIVKVDNFARESIADTLIAENVNEYWGSWIVNRLNENTDENGSNYFQLFDDNYVLWRGMDELV